VYLTLLKDFFVGYLGGKLVTLKRHVTSVGFGNIEENFGAETSMMEMGAFLIVPLRLQIVQEMGVLLKKL